MKTTVTGRHVDITPALRAYVEERVNRVARYSDLATQAAVILTVEKYRHTADVSLNVNGVVIQAKEETSEMYASIDQAVEKIERQLKKHKDRLHDHRQRAEPAPPDITEGGEPVIRETVVRESVDLSTLTPEAAARRLDGGGQAFVVFRHADTSRVNVVYRKQDGTAGWIDPAP